MAFQVVALISACTYVDKRICIFRCMCNRPTFRDDEEREGPQGVGSVSASGWLALINLLGVKDRDPVFSQQVQHVPTMVANSITTYRRFAMAINYGVGPLVLRGDMKTLSSVISLCGSQSS